MSLSDLLLAFGAALSPFVMGVIKELLAAKKIKTNAETLAAATKLQGDKDIMVVLKEQVEFLNEENDKLRKSLDDNDDKWHQRYEDLRKQFDVEHEARFRAEAKLDSMKPTN